MKKGRLIATLCSLFIIGTLGVAHVYAETEPEQVSEVVAVSEVEELEQENEALKEEVQQKEQEKQLEELRQENESLKNDIKKKKKNNVVKWSLIAGLFSIVMFCNIKGIVSV